MAQGAGRTRASTSRPAAKAIVEVLSSVPPQATEADLTLEQASRRVLDGNFGLLVREQSGRHVLRRRCLCRYGLWTSTASRHSVRSSLMPSASMSSGGRSEAIWCDLGSLRIACDGGSAMCLITGVVDWDCRSVQSGGHILSGVAVSLLRVAFAASGAGRIVREAGSVIARSASALSKLRCLDVERSLLIAPTAWRAQRR